MVENGARKLILIGRNQSVLSDTFIHMSPMHSGRKANASSTEVAMNWCTFLGLLSVFVVASFICTTNAASGGSQETHPDVLDKTSKYFIQGEKKYRVIEVTGETFNEELGHYVKKAMKQIQDDIRKDVEDKEFHVRFIVVLKNAVRITGMSGGDIDVGAEELKKICINCGMQYVIVSEHQAVRSFIAVALKSYTSAAEDVGRAKEILKNDERHGACRMTALCT